MPLPKANLNHPAFPQPPDQSILVWRYLDLAKYVSLLTRKTLYLAAVDRLGDPFEGSLPRRTRELWRQAVLREIGPDAAPELVRNLQQHDLDMSRLAARMRRAHYANCWRMGNHESEAMWKLYCDADQGVALVLPYRQLADSLSDPRVHIGCVSYLDYDRAVLDLGNTYYPFMHKRLAFVHEQEVRILQAGNWPALIGNPDIDLPVGVDLPWEPEEHVEHVVVNPYARRWFHDAVRDLTRALAPRLTDRVRESGMGGEPTF
jgi:hypothetical protein